MKKTIFFLSFLLTIPLTNSFCLFEPVDTLESSNIKQVIIYPFNPEVICVASRNSLYKSTNAAESFEKIAVFKDENIQHIFFDCHLAGVLYIATTRHLYRFKDELEQIYSISEEDGIIYAAAKRKGVIYVGTACGLRFASEDSLIWHTAKCLKNFLVYYIEPAVKGLYLASDRGVYFFGEDGFLQRLFVMRAENEDEGQFFLAKVIKADNFNKERIWLGTNQGLYNSTDLGKNWQKVFISGIDNLPINCIAQTNLSKEGIFLGTEKGFFPVDPVKKTSKQIFEGLSSSYISWVDITSRGVIYLATSNGLFQNDYFTASLKGNLAKKNRVFSFVPSIREVQQVVMRYNEVHPEKIKKWRESLKYRALFPAISLDYDKTVSVSTNPNYKEAVVGPHDWGVSFSWNVGDLIWNSYEDDVDTRARLDTQLRLDILDEINRVYFERLRLSREISSGNVPEEKLQEKQLRLEELTAIIDGYTGGYFSARINESDEQNF
ncbi:MAG: hypothetical protein PHE97_05320 [Candidatus Omnitrophica bacterium]|nr:hypothetical protein [Candidatus Omnitrophota bacterium]